jgi:hypothetical protein
MIRMRAKTPAHLPVNIGRGVKALSVNHDFREKGIEGNLKVPERKISHPALILDGCPDDRHVRARRGW